MRSVAIAEFTFKFAKIKTEPVEQHYRPTNGIIYKRKNGIIYK